MAKLAIYSGEKFEREIELGPRTARIGRGDQNEIVLPDPAKSVSRFHAELRFEDGRYTIVDLNSQNGTWIAGKRVTQAVLEPGIPVVLGTYRLVFVPDVAAIDAEKTMIAGVPFPAASTPAAQAPSGPSAPPSAPPRPAPAPAPAAPAARVPAAGPGPAPGPVHVEPPPPAAPASSEASKPSVKSEAAAPPPAAAPAPAPKPVTPPVPARGPAPSAAAPPATPKPAPPAAAAPPPKPPAAPVPPKPAAPAAPPAPAAKVAAPAAKPGGKKGRGVLVAGVFLLLVLAAAAAGVYFWQRTTGARAPEGASQAQAASQAGAPATTTPAATTPAPVSEAAAPAATTAAVQPPVAEPRTRPSAVPPAASGSGAAKKAPAESPAARTDVAPRARGRAEGASPKKPAPEPKAKPLNLAQTLEQARSAMIKGDYVGAIAGFESILKVDPKYPEAADLLGVARNGARNAAQLAVDAGDKAQMSGDYDGAAKQYERAQQLDADSTAPADAMRRLKARMQGEGEDAFKRGKQFDAMGRSSDAIAMYEKAIKLLPADHASVKVAKERLAALRGGE